MPHVHSSSTNTVSETNGDDEHSDGELGRLIDRKHVNSTDVENEATNTAHDADSNNTNLQHEHVPVDTRLKSLYNTTIAATPRTRSRPAPNLGSDRDHARQRRTMRAYIKLLRAETPVGRDIVLARADDDSDSGSGYEPMFEDDWDDLPQSSPKPAFKLTVRTGSTSAARNLNARTHFWQPGSSLLLLTYIIAMLVLAIDMQYATTRTRETPALAFERLDVRLGTDFPLTMANAHASGVLVTNGSQAGGANTGSDLKPTTIRKER